MKRILPLLLALILLAACGRTDPDELPQSMTNPMIADHTLWQQEPYYILQFNVDSVISNAPNVMASASRIIISQGGTYLISGTLQDAQLVIDAPAGETVRLVLRGVDMQCERGPAILSRGAGPVVLLLEDGTENTVTDGKNYFYSGSAVIESVISTGGDLLVTGGGSLSVSASHNDALHSEKRLVLSGGTVTVTAWRNGLTAKTSLELQNGQLSVACGAVGIAVGNEKKPGGNVLLSGGAAALICGGDGITATGSITVSDGTCHITTGGGSTLQSYGETADKWGVWGGLPQQQPTEESITLRRDPIVSATARGLWAGKMLAVTGGSLTLDCSDVALYSTGNLVVGGGHITLSGGDTALFAEQLTLTAGELTVQTARRGIVSRWLTVSGGRTSLSTAEEGLLLGGGYGQDQSPDETRCMTVTGGLLSVRSGTHAADLNGSYFQSDGVVLLGSGREQNPLRSPTADINGGTLLAAGYLPAELVLSTNLPRIGVELWLTAGRPFTVTAAGESTPLLTFTPEAPVGSVTLISDRLQRDVTYHLASGSARTGAVPH